MRTIRYVAAIAAIAVPLSATATTFYVDDNAPASGNGRSWATAFDKLQSALAVARTGDQVWIAVGTYRPTTPGGNRAIAFEPSGGVAIYGGFRGNETSLADRAGLFADTHLSGDLNSNDVAPYSNSGENSYNVVRVTAPGVVLDGVNIERGNANGSGSGQGTSGGLRISYGAVPVIRNCFFSYNQSTGSSGGGAIESFASEPLELRKCTFFANFATGTFGGGAVSASSVTLVDCSFVGNESSNGGGAVSSLDHSVVVRCDFVRNRATGSSGGGALIGFQGVSLYNCRFFGNVASDAAFGGGAVSAVSGDWLVANCLFSGNTASGSGGGGAIAIGGTGRLINCTFVSNSAPNTNQAGGVNVLGSESTEISNCILWNNTNSGGLSLQAQRFAFVAPLQVNFSCIQFLSPSVGGVGNTGRDPLFRSLAGPDFVVGTPDDDARLVTGSPCNDAGSADLLPPDIYDLDNDGDTAEPLPVDLAGSRRRVDDVNAPDTGPGARPSVDMGAYEFAQSCAADLTGDGRVDLLDLSTLLAHFGEICW